MSTLSARPVLADVVWSASGTQLWLKRLFLVVAGVAALWISAKTQIASEPVPVTLQVLVVSVIGAAYGPRMAAATLGAYLLAGAAGQPVFAGTPQKGIGLAYMMGPTGGYLLGFWLQATLIGALAARGWDRSMGRMALAMVLGLVALYVPGVIWLSAGFGMAFGWENWWTYGVLPFIWIDALKLVVAVIAFPVIWRLVGDARA